MRWNSRRSGTGPSSATASLPLDETSCRAEAPARINGVMASPAQSVAIAPTPGLPLVRHGHARWLVRAPGQRGALSPEEAAHALKAKRSELRRRLDWRRDVAGLPEHVRDELVDEAIGVVVMASKPIRDEQHLQGGNRPDRAGDGRPNAPRRVRELPDLLRDSRAGNAWPRVPARSERGFPAAPGTRRRAARSVDRATGLAAHKRTDAERHRDSRAHRRAARRRRSGKGRRRHERHRGRRCRRWSESRSHARINRSGPPPSQSHRPFGVERARSEHHAADHCCRKADLDSQHDFIEACRQSAYTTPRVAAEQESRLSGDRGECGRWQLSTKHVCSNRSVNVV
jgi:hypothetical protein